MNKARHHLLPAVGFSAALLGAVHMATFVWQTAFVYKGNIRGYVPAGCTGGMYLSVAVVGVTIYMGLVGQRRASGSYLAGGCLGVPVALLATSASCSLVLRVAGYSLQTDIAVAVVCGVLCLLTAIVIHQRWLRRRLD